MSARMINRNVIVLTSALNVMENHTRVQQVCTLLKRVTSQIYVQNAQTTLLITLVLQEHNLHNLAMELICVILVQLIKNQKPAL